MAPTMSILCVAFLTVLNSYLPCATFSLEPFNRFPITERLEMDPFAETERSPADCVNYYKEVIPERSTYTPVEDPCTLCVCINGEPKYCEFTHCSTPKPTKDCPTVVVSATDCCAFDCLDGPYDVEDVTMGEYITSSEEWD